MNTPRDLANSSECRELLQKAEALRAPSAEEAGHMHAENLQVFEGPVIVASRNRPL